MKIPVFKDKKMARDFIEEADYTPEKAKKMLNKAIANKEAAYLEPNDFLIFWDDDFHIGEPGIEKNFAFEDDKGKSHPVYVHQIFPVLDSSFKPWYTADIVLLKLPMISLYGEVAPIFPDQESYDNYINETAFMSKAEIKALQSQPLYSFSKDVHPVVKKNSVFFESWKDCSVYVRLRKSDAKEAKNFTTFRTVQGTCTKLCEGDSVQIVSYLGLNGKENQVKEGIKYKCFGDAILGVQNENGTKYWIQCKDLLNLKKKKKS